MNDDSLIHEDFPAQGEVRPSHEGSQSSAPMKGGMLMPYTPEDKIGKYIIQRNADKMVKFGNDIINSIRGNK